MIGWAIETLLASTGLMLVVLLARGPVTAWAGPRAAYALWLLPALRMVMPSLPEAPVPMVRALPFDIAALEASLTAPSPADYGVDWLTVLLIIWGMGTIGFGLAQLLRYRRFLARALAGAIRLSDEDGVAVRAGPGIDGPAATGLVAPMILLPHDFARRYAPQEQRLALAHERAHHRRRDIAANAAAVAMLALHWFNPLAHYAYRRFRIDQELACDATVLAGADPTVRHSYGRALAIAAGMAPAAPAAAFYGIPTLKRRLKMIGRDGASVARQRLGRAAVVILIGGGLVLTASGGVASEAARTAEARIAPVVAPIVAAFPVPVAPPAPLPPQVAMPAPPRAPQPPAAPMAPQVPAVSQPPALPASFAEGTSWTVGQADWTAAAAARADAEALHAIREARLAAEGADETARDAAEARRDALQDAADARREGLAAAAEARREAAEARHEALKEAAETRREALLTVRRIDGAKMAREIQAEVRAEMRDACRRQGHMVASGADWRALATCAGAYRKTTIRSLEGARVAILRDRQLDTARRDRALAAVDRQLERLRAGH